MSDKEFVDLAWRRACEIAYQRRTVARGNDGDPRFDLKLDQRLVNERQAAIEFIATETGIPQSDIDRGTQEAAHNYGNAPGTDHDPDHFAPPKWQQTRAKPPPKTFERDIEGGMSMD